MVSFVVTSRHTSGLVLTCLLPVSRLVLKNCLWLLLSKFIACSGYLLFDSEVAKIRVILFPLSKGIFHMKMNFAKYCGILYYRQHHSYPQGCSSEADKKKIGNAARSYLHHHGVLYRKEPGSHPGREVLHEGSVEEVVSRVHEEGHIGISNTWRRLRVQYEGRQMLVRRLVGSCSTWQARAKRKQRNQAPLSPIPSPATPFYMIGCDAVGPMLPSTAGNRYLSVAVDYLTRWPCVQAVPYIIAETTALFLLDQAVTNHGVPSFILTDQGSYFTSLRFFLSASLGMSSHYYHRISPSNQWLGGTNESNDSSDTIQDCT